MILPYSLRLICLSLSVFFLAYLAFSLSVSLVAPVAIRQVRRIRANQAADILALLRLGPAIGGAALAGMICLPSFLLFEPRQSSEEIGVFCVAGAVFCMVWCSYAILRTARAFTRSRQFIGQCRAHRSEMPLISDEGPVWVLEASGVGVALLGMLHPRFMVSAALAQAMPADELSAALRHERAHWAAHDNIKRLLFLLTPDLLAGRSGFARLEQAWARFAEWAADDRATAGDPHRSIALAAALVRVARIGVERDRPLLTSTLLADGYGLEERVIRLLRPGAQDCTRKFSLWVAGGVIGIAAGLTLVTASSGATFRIFEAFMH